MAFSIRVTMKNPGFKLREKIYKRVFRIQDFLKKLHDTLNPLLKGAFILASLFFFVLVIIQIGFSGEGEFFEDAAVYYAVFYVIFISRYLPEFMALKKRNRLRWFVDGALFAGGIVFIGLFHRHQGADTSWINYSLSNFALVNLYLFLLIIAEMHRVMKFVNTLQISPSLLFAGSFLLAIFLGSGMLMLPNAHHGQLGYLDALFTSTSAVCVTGLAVVDTSTEFTRMGQLIILGLIQIGGLGIMTFTGFFGYIFTGTASLKDRVLLREVISTETMGSLFKALVQIMIVTFGVEIAGAVLIYFSINQQIESPFFFSVFHAISAFCNAGFSTIGNGLANPAISQNYSFQVIIAFLIILGGIGFPVLLGLIRYFRFGLRQISLPSHRRVKKWRIFVNDSGVRMVLTLTVVLVIAGTVLYYFLEQNGSLAGQDGLGKLVISFFGSVSARTAGFNVIDISQWSTATIFVMIFLMWVGASPGSTGGGIKTTTFAIALKACWDFVRGRQRVELYNRELGTETLLRVLVVILLSLGVILSAYIAMLVTDSTKNPVDLLFECFSAFGTVGLSIVNTATLSGSGKVIIMVLMFLGRLGPLTVLSGLLFDARPKYYRFPQHDFVIN